MEKLQKKNPVLIFIIVNYLHYLGSHLLWLFQLCPKPILSTWEWFIVVVLLKECYTCKFVSESKGSIYDSECFNTSTVSIPYSIVCPKEIIFHWQVCVLCWFLRSPWLRYVFKAEFQCIVSALESEYLPTELVLCKRVHLSGLQLFKTFFGKENSECLVFTRCWC